MYIPKGPPLDRRLTTIVAADLVGYSRLMAADEEGTIARLQGLLADVIRPEIANHDGRVVKTMGDGLLVEFPSTVAALKSTLAIQTRVARSEADTGEDRRMAFRVGINLGDVVIDGDDILGDGVNIAARLESLAPPGGICVSRAVYEQVKGKVRAGYTDLGPQQVKNIPDPVEVWRVEIDGVQAVAAKPAQPAKRPSIVVLPFDNMSSDPEQDYLADGIVEDVTTELSRFRTLFVIARNSAFAYKGISKDVREIARDLDVNYIVEGSVRRAGNRLRITAQLIEAATGNHIWAERWDRTMDDLFDVQDEMTSAIVSGVEPELGAHERNLVRRKPTANLTAWELYQRGVTERVKSTDAGLAEARALFQRALELDPDFALANAMLAYTYWLTVASARSADPTSDITKGIACARLAIEMDDREEMAHVARGLLLATVGDETEAMSCIETALALNPNNASCHNGMSLVCLFQKSPDGARMEQSARTAIRLSPRDPRAFTFQFMAGVGESVKNNFRTSEGVIQSYRDACTHPNTDWFVYLAAATAFVNIGEADQARTYLNKALARKTDLTMETYRTAFVFPAWPEWFEHNRADLEKLVELGLPRD